MVARYIFARAIDPPLPIYGDHSVIAIQKWLLSLRERGVTAPNKGRYPLKVYAAALGADLPIWHPGITATMKMPKKRGIRQAAPLPVEVIAALEKVAINQHEPRGRRYYASMFILMTMASLRCCDTRGVFDLRVSGSAICGLPADRRRKNKELTQWASPKGGIATDTRFEPITRWRGKIAPKEGHSANLLPRIGNGWELVSRRAGTSGAVQAVLSKLEKGLGFSLGLRLRSPMAFFAA